MLLHGKSHFANVIEVADLRERGILDCPGGPDLITQAFKSSDLSLAGDGGRWQEEKVGLFFLSTGSISLLVGDSKNGES